ncbi:ImmA/IrrE family metallo-endopeptidase [Streptococcus anginosus]|jgi:hypothetical protein|uniref:ImmA/IrrE family metallo-endopeptidase n=1 Tax=Streptococcus anginosus TaxID=1328 RepID=UPI0039C0E43B
MTEIAYFDGRDTEIKGVYNKPFDIVFVNAYLDDIEMKKVTYHELGHKEHTSTDYKYNRERCELQADRNMIHHLIKDALKDLENPKDFNYLNFMNHYDLRTITDEIMVKEEFYNLANII